MKMLPEVLFCIPAITAFLWLFAMPFWPESTQKGMAEDFVIYYFLVNGFYWLCFLFAPKSDKRLANYGSMITICLAWKQIA